MFRGFGGYHTKNTNATNIPGGKFKHEPIPGTGHRKGPTIHTEEALFEVYRLYQQGHTADEVAKMTGLNRFCIHKWVNGESRGSVLLKYEKQFGRLRTPVLGRPKQK